MNEASYRRERKGFDEEMGLMCRVLFCCDD